MSNLEWQDHVAQTTTGTYEVQQELGSGRWATYRNGQLIHVAGFQEGAKDQAQNDHNDRLRKRQRRASKAGA